MWLQNWFVILLSCYLVEKSNQAKMEENTDLKMEKASRSQEKQDENEGENK